MPRAWSSKDERQYEHVKQSELEQGRSSKRAKSIAAATVNKQRAAEGRTKGAAARKRAGSRTMRSRKARASRTRARRRAAA